MSTENFNGRARAIPTQHPESQLFCIDQANTVLRQGNAGAPIDYDPFGYQHNTAFEAYPSFNGHLIEMATQTYLLGNGHRTFNPVLRRFHSPDTLSPFGNAGINMYAYCLGDPINRTDPSGKTPVLIKRVLRRLKFMDETPSDYLISLMAPSNTIFQWNPHFPLHRQGVNIDRNIEFYIAVHHELKGATAYRLNSSPTLGASAIAIDNSIIPKAIEDNISTLKKLIADREFLLTEHDKYIKNALKISIEHHRPTRAYRRAKRRVTWVAPPPSPSFARVRLIRQPDG